MALIGTEGKARVDGESGGALNQAVKEMEEGTKIERNTAAGIKTNLGKHPVWPVLIIEAMEPVRNEVAKLRRRGTSEEKHTLRKNPLGGKPITYLLTSRGTVRGNVVVATARNNVAAWKDTLCHEVNHIVNTDEKADSEAHIPTHVFENEFRAFWIGSKDKAMPGDTEKELDAKAERIKGHVKKYPDVARALCDPEQQEFQAFVKNYKRPSATDNLDNHHEELEGRFPDKKKDKDSREP